MEDTYSIPVACNNCDYSGTKTLLKGTPFNTFGVTHNSVCPTCGCNTLTKSASAKLDRPYMVLKDNMGLCHTSEELAKNTHAT